MTGKPAIPQQSKTIMRAVATAIIYESARLDRRIDEVASQTDELAVAKGLLGDVARKNLTALTIHDLAKHELCHILAASVYIANRHRFAYKDTRIHVSVTQKEGQVAVETPDREVKPDEHDQLMGFTSLGPVVEFGHLPVEAYAAANATDVHKRAGLSDPDIHNSRLIDPQKTPIQYVQRLLAATYHLRQAVDFPKLAKLLRDPRLR